MGSCKQSFNTKTELLHHIGVDHEKAMGIYNSIVLALSNFGKVEARMVKYAALFYICLYVSG